MNMRLVCGWRACSCWRWKCEERGAVHTDWLYVFI